ncbi:hypothetical protein [Microcoleus sp. OTE_8_concoct_300]|uniref:hypothetical protein n=1 Tax=Microcoleus sp. OTE_8_concoct_300 TaxID=2964710 RepID=UPI00403F45EC
MDFEEYIKRMKATLEKMEASGPYDISYIIYPPMTDIEDFEEIIEEHGIDGFHLGLPLKEFYQLTMSVTFTWVYRHRTNECYFTGGVSNLSLISVIYEPEERITGEFNLYKGYRIFYFVRVNEYVLDGNYVAGLFVEGRE